MSRVEPPLGNRSDRFWVHPLKLNYIIPQNKKKINIPSFRIRLKPSFRISSFFGDQDLGFSLIQFGNRKFALDKKVAFKV